MKLLGFLFLISTSLIAKDSESTRQSCYQYLISQVKSVAANKLPKMEIFADEDGDQVQMIYPSANPSKNFSEIEIWKEGDSIEIVSMYTDKNMRGYGLMNKLFTKYFETYQNINTATTVLWDTNRDIFLKSLFDRIKDVHNLKVKVNSSFSANLYLANADLLKKLNDKELEEALFYAAKQTPVFKVLKRHGIDSVKSVNMVVFRSYSDIDITIEFER